MPNYGEAPLGTTVLPTHAARHMGTFDIELHPQLWRVPEILPYYRGRQWTKKKFVSTLSTEIPEQSGIYLFVVAPHCAALDDHSYIFYIGQAKNLRIRYRQYLLERHGKGSNRELVVRFLTHFDGFVHFHYTLIPEAELNRAENLLIDNLTPFANKKVADFRGRLNEAVVG